MPGALEDIRVIDFTHALNGLFCTMLLGHLGADKFIGKGGSDFIDAVDGRRDKLINCGGGGHNDVMLDPSDPRPSAC